MSVLSHTVSRFGATCALFFALLLTHPSQAATLTVNSTTDVVAADGVLTLREAVLSCNANADINSDATANRTGAYSPPSQYTLSNADTIVIPSAGTITLSGNEIPITEDLKITAFNPNTQFVSGAGHSRIFNISRGSASISNLGFINGNTTGDGGAILTSNGGVLELTHCVFNNNTCSGSTGGGAVRCGAYITPLINQCLFSNNTATGAGSGGGALSLDTNTYLTSCTLANNSASHAGGLFLKYGGTLTNCTLVGNTANGTDSTNSGGGALECITNNTLTLSSCTLTGNSAPNVAGGARSGLWLKQSYFQFDNCIIAGNGPQDIQQDAGQIQSRGFNLIGNPGSTSGYGGSNGLSARDRTGITLSQLKLGALADNGGPVPTCALLPGSIAIDAGKPYDSLTTDARGSGRPVDFPDVTNATGGDGSDVGAFELNETPQDGPAFVVNQYADKDDGVCGPTNCTLSEAINAANASPGANTITFASELSMIVLISGRNLPPITGDLTIQGRTSSGKGIEIYNPFARGGATMSVSSGLVDIGDLTFAFGYGGLVNSGASTKTTLSNCTFNGTVVGNNTVVGATNQSGATLVMNNCTVNGSGTGSYTPTIGVSNSDGTITLNSCTVTGNTTGITGTGTLNVFNSIVAGNTTNVNAPLATDDHNLLSGTAAQAGLDTKGLQDNGGPTQTVALLVGSPAIDTGSTQLATDQRGIARPQRNGVDIGAYEYVNQAPLISNVALAPTTPLTNDTLTATPTATDAENDSFSYTYQWKKNGVVIAGENGATLDLSKAGNGDKSDVITVTVTANDGTASSAPFTSDAVTVGNSAPVVSNMVIDQSAPQTNDTLTFSLGTLTDADGDTLTPTYQWKKNGAALSGQTGASLDLSQAGNGDRGDVISVVVTVSDGTVTASSESNAVTVIDSPPTISAVALTPLDPKTNSVLTAVPTASDADGDSLSYSYKWMRNGVTLSDETGPTLDLSKVGNGDKGDKISVIVTASAGEQSSAPLASNEVTIVNSAPVIPDVTISPSSPTTNTTLSLAVGTPTDADGDSLILTFQWQKNGGDLTGETGPTLDLSKAGNGDKGDVISVIVRAFDGSATSAVFSPPVTIVNSAPMLGSVTLAPTGPKTDDPLTATASASDADGDTLSYTFTWTRVRSGKTTTIRTQTNTTGTDTLPTTGAVVVAGDTITVSVVVSDGAASSTAKSATVTIGNTPVSIGQLTLTPVTPKTNSVLVVNAQLLDADGGRSTNTYVWTRTHAGQTSEVFRETTNGSQSRLDLSKAGMGDKGDTLTVMLTASDGASSATKSASVKVANSLPTLSGLKLAPTSPTVTGQVTATFTASDLDVTDGVDSFKYLFSWKAGGKSLSDEKGATVNLSKYKFLKAGDTLTLQLRIGDGTAISSTQTASVKLSAAPTTPKNSAGNS